MEFKAITFLTFMITINVVLFFAQGAMSESNPDVQYIDVNSSPAGQMMNEGTNSTLPDISSGEDYNDAETQISTGSDFLRAAEGAWGVVSGLFSQPAGFMKEVGVPRPIRNGFNAIWYTVMIVLIVGWIRGKNQ